MKNIVFIGFMCSGKTTIGRTLAKRQDYKFIDTDQWIRKKEKMDIGDIFEKKGEDYFRKLETKTVKHFANNLSNTVVSTGGGLSVRQENIPYLKEIGTVIYLSVSKDTVLSRLNPNIERPLLSVDDPEKRIEELLEERNPIYEKAADLIIDTNNKTISKIVDEIIERLEDL